MIVRNPTPGEVEVAADVASKAFQNLSYEFWQESFRTVADMFGERFILIVELDGKIVSSLVCCPAPILVNEAEVTHSSVGAVGTLPEYRKMGCAGAMMMESAKLLREEGIHTSSLWPFSYSYYRKFGWEVGAESRAYRATGGVFAELGDASKARAATPEDLRDILLCYEAFAECYNCCTVRSEDWWHKIARLPADIKMVTEPGRGVVVHQNGSIVDGYAVYDLEEGIINAETGEKGRWIEVKEIVWTAPIDRLHMLALIGGIGPDLKMAFYSPLDDLLLHEIPDPRAVSATVNPSFQFRIIDPEGAMGSLKALEGSSGKVTLSISDPVFKHGWQFGVEFDDGEVSLCKPGRSNILEMDVHTLAKLYSGYLAPFDALVLGQVRCHDARAVATACDLFSCFRPLRSWLEPG